MPRGLERGVRDERAVAAIEHQAPAPLPHEVHEVEIAVVIDVGPGVAVSPLRHRRQPGLRGGLDETAAVVTEQARADRVAQVEVEVAVVVVVQEHRAFVEGQRQSELGAHVGEGAGPVVHEQMATGVEVDVAVTVPVRGRRTLGLELLGLADHRHARNLADLRERPALAVIEHAPVRRHLGVVRHVEIGPTVGVEVRPHRGLPCPTIPIPSGGPRSSKGAIGPLVQHQRVHRIAVRVPRDHQVQATVAVVVAPGGAVKVP